MQSLFLGIPTYSGIAAPTMGAVSGLIFSGKFRVSLSLYPHCALIGLARAELVSKFVHSPCDYLCFIDSDIAFEPSLIDRMVGTGKDVVTSIYCARRKPHNALVNFDGPSSTHMDLSGVDVAAIEAGNNGERIIGVHSSGLGCCIFSRKAIEATCQHFPELKYISRESEKEAWALFMERVEPVLPDNKVRFLGEDVAFFARLHEAGFPAYAMVDATVIHDDKEFCLAEALSV